MEILIAKTKIDQKTLKALCDAWFDDMVKVVVDIERHVAALGGDLHADAETLLLQEGSTQRNLWGANIYPYQHPENRIEYTALINIRPHQDNLSMEISDENIRKSVKKIIHQIVMAADETLV